MIYRTRRLAALLLTSALMLVAVPMAAAQTTTHDGLVNVSVGDITITDAVDIGVAAQIAANICDVKVGPVVVLGVAVDRSGDSRTVCTTDQGEVTINQN